MPSGKTHDRLIVVSTPVVSLAGGFFGYQMGDVSIPIALTSAFLFGGFLFSPDLDCRSYPYYRWGWIRWLWVPYQNLIPRHRSVLSHGLIVGTALRLVYLFGSLAVIALLTLLAYHSWLIRQEFWVVLGAGDWQTAIALLGAMFNRGFADTYTGTQWIRDGINTYSITAIAVFVGLELSAAVHYVSDWSVSTWKKQKG